MSSRKFRALATNPRAYQRFLQTGRLPHERVIRDTPLVAAIRKIPPKVRAHLRGFTITSKLGYQGPVRIHTVEQAFRWLGGYRRTRLSTDPPIPAESRIIHRFTRPVTWEMLRAHINGDIPDPIEDRLARILR